MKDNNNNKKKKNDKSSFTQPPDNVVCNVDIYDYINYFQSVDDENDYNYEFNDDTSFLQDERNIDFPNIDFFNSDSIDIKSPKLSSNDDDDDAVKNANTNQDDIININNTNQNLNFFTQPIESQKNDSKGTFMKSTLIPHHKKDDVCLRANSRRKNMLSLKSDEVLFKDAFYRACGLSTKCDKKYVLKLYHVVCSSIGLREMTRREKRSIDLFFKNFSKNSILIINAIKKYIQENPEIRREIYLSKIK